MESKNCAAAEFDIDLIIGRKLRQRLLEWRVEFVLWFAFDFCIALFIGRQLGQLLFG